MHYLLNVVPGSESARRRVDLELGALAGFGRLSS